METLESFLSENQALVTLVGLDASAALNGGTDYVSGVHYDGCGPRPPYFLSAITVPATVLHMP